MNGTTLDASTLIAALDPDHANHTKAAAQLRETTAPLWLHPVTLAEVLVPYVDPNDILDLLYDIGIEVFDADQGLPTMTRQHAIDLAKVRRISRAKMPDACVITTAWLTGTPIASLDNGLLAAAARFAEIERTMGQES